MNAYLPTLAQESPDVVSTRQELEDHDALHADTDTVDSDLVTDSPAAPLLPSYPQATSEHRKNLEARYQTVLARETSRISSLGIALGYGSGILLLALTLLPVTKLHGSTFALRLAIGLSGIWWFVFSIPAAVLLPSRPASAREIDEKEFSFRREVINAWTGLANRLRWGEVKKLKNTFKFLAAWFLLSDGEHAVLLILSLICLLIK
jgi:UMF1 family MFS transporter